MSRHAGVAQLVEHLIRNEGVVGSSPITGTTNFRYRAHSARLRKLSEVAAQRKRRRMSHRSLWRRRTESTQVCFSLSRDR